MSGVVYTLCALTALLCSYLLLKSYFISGTRLLLWSGLCFIGMTVNNCLLVVDMIFLPHNDLSILRLVPAFAGISLLIVGLVLETD